MFNLSKHSQTGAIENAVEMGGLEEFPDQLSTQINDTQEELKGEGEGEGATDNLTDAETADRENLLWVSSLKKAYEEINKLGSPEGPAIWNMLVQNMLAKNVANPGVFDSITAEIEQGESWQSFVPGVDAQVSAKYTQEILPQINNLLTLYRNPPEGVQVFSENKKQHKTAQGVFRSGGEFAAAYQERLLTNDPEVYKDAVNEILSSIQGDIQEEEINSALETLWNLNPETDQGKAVCILGRIWDILPAHLKAQQEEQPQPMETLMSENKNPNGIIKFNLSDHILNNKAATVPNMVKTANEMGQHSYILYGPSEKRICPKLRGKGGGFPGSNDVVSEYICRHHCLDGIVIDDNKTICGEALWRAHAMDKFSREYVNADGDIVGGYLNKRFEINRNVDEENRMRLKPGEVRKARPPEMGSTESRMQAMRNKEGEKRGYRPDTNTAKPFNWSKDVDQNNVEVTQAERDRREEDSGHETANYTNKDEQENNPKIAQFASHKVATGFNMKHFKTAAASATPFEWAEKTCIRCGEKGRFKGSACSRCLKDEDKKEAARVNNDTVQKVERKQLAVDIQKEHTNKNAQSGAVAPVPDDGKPIEPKEEKIKKDNHISRKKAQTSFTGGPQKHRTFEEMGRDFSPEGPYSHCDVCRKRTKTDSLITEEHNDKRYSVCSKCRTSEKQSGFNFRHYKMSKREYHKSKSSSKKKT